MVEVARRRQLAAYLRSHRERLTPVDVGIIEGPRRRTPGLRREEVALLSGVSVTWYTWIEQARDIVVSRQVLDSIAKALRLAPAERRQLFGLAGEPLPAGGPAREPSVALQRMVDAQPYPAYLVSPRWDLLAWNRAKAGLIGDPSRLAEPERNTVWIVFTDPVQRRLLVDWRRQALGMLAQYRIDAAQYPKEPRFAALTESLRQASTEFRDWWDHDVITDFQPTRRLFDHPELGRLTFDHVKLAVVETPELKLITLVPADEATAAACPALMSHHGALAN
jgi:transcriptional regulator with XRE-family HTH domain